MEFMCPCCPCFNSWFPNLGLKHGPHHGPHGHHGPLVRNAPHVTNQALLVAKPDAVFAYDPDEGNMSAMPLDGQKLLLEQFKSYFVAGSPRSHPMRVLQLYHDYHAVPT